MNKKIAIYPGVFDPLTVGHMWVINECLKLYDSVVVAVATNPEKDSLFSTKERVAMLQNACTELKRVEIVHFEKEFLVNFAKEKGVQCIVRSIRTESDYEYERVLNHINRDINPDITTVFLMPPRGLSEVSSRMVKQLIGLNGWEQIVGKYVPKEVLESLKKFHANSAE